MALRTPITKKLDHFDLARWGLDRLWPRERFELDALDRVMCANRKTRKARQSRSGQGHAEPVATRRLKNQHLYPLQN
jgi:hypothetical protein